MPRKRRSPALFPLVCGTHRQILSGHCLALSLAHNAIDSRRLACSWRRSCSHFWPSLGCQNNSERDIIARDRRMQEDQIYAMQDYVQQYQQLVCRYRSENASLRRQLSQGHADDSYDDQPQPMPATRSRRPARNSPQFESPRTPPADNSRSSRTTRKLKCRKSRPSRRRHGTI